MQKSEDSMILLDRLILNLTIMSHICKFNRLFVTKI